MRVDRLFRCEATDYTQRTPTACTSVATCDSCLRRREAGLTPSRKLVYLQPFSRVCRLRDVLIPYRSVRTGPLLIRRRARGAPLPRGLTSKTRLQNAQINTLLLRSIDAIAAAKPANEAAAMRALKGSVKRAAAASDQAGLADQLIAAIAWPIVFVDALE